MPNLVSPKRASSRRRSDPLDLGQQIVVVTGAGRGLGRAIAIELAHRRASIALTYLKEREATSLLAKEISDQGGRAISLQADVTDFQSVRRLIEGVTAHFGRLTAVVNNAGIIRDKSLMMMESQDWRDVIETNLTGTYNVCRAAIVTLMKQKYGRIVNITSVAGISGIARQTNYSASKAGVIGFTKALAKEVASYGITVNAVAPGYIAAGMATALNEKQQEEARATIPLGRFGKPEEVAGAVVYLLSDTAAYVTGHVFVVDGGASL